MVLEDFKGFLPEKVVMFLNEQKVTSLSKAAVLADDCFNPQKCVCAFLPPTSVSRPMRPDSSHSASQKRLKDCHHLHMRFVSVSVVTRKVTSLPTACH